MEGSEKTPCLFLLFGYSTTGATRTEGNWLLGRQKDWKRLPDFLSSFLSTTLDFRHGQ